MVEDLFQQLCQLNFATGDSDATANNKFFSCNECLSSLFMFLRIQSQQVLSEFIIFAIHLTNMFVFSHSAHIKLFTPVIIDLFQFKRVQHQI